MLRGDLLAGYSCDNVDQDANNQDIDFVTSGDLNALDVEGKPPHALHLKLTLNI